MLPLVDATTIGTMLLSSLTNLYSKWYSIVPSTSFFAVPVYSALQV